VHVDDFMITAMSEAMLDHLLADMNNAFGDVSVVRGRKHDYLGMVFDFTSDVCLRVSILTTVDDILSCARTGNDVASSPASNTLFSIDSTSALLSDVEREYFHSKVAKLLYLAKRVRPDILLAISFLSTRVRCPTEQDMSKLDRVLKYLNGTKTLGLSMRGETVVCVCAYIDASYAVHDDFKSHS